MDDATRVTEADTGRMPDDACASCGATPAMRYDLVPMFGRSRRAIGGTALCDTCMERLNTFPEDDVPLWRREEALQRRLARRAADHGPDDGPLVATPPPELAEPEPAVTIAVEGEEQP